jgi:DNA repair protein RecN (Recombination protein N)
MLRRLALEEFVIIERAAPEFAPGLNALTGETGAGKSILIDAIGLLCGGRASSEWVRRGASRLLVEGEIDLSRAPAARAAAGELGVPLEDDRILLLRREVAADGRSRCFAGGRQVLVSQLRELTVGAVWIVGQGEQRALADPAEQEWILDRFGDVLKLRETYRARRAAFLEGAAFLERLRADEAAFARDREWLQAQAEEIRETGIAPGDRVRLREQLTRLQGRAAEASLRDEVEGRLFREEGSVLDQLETLVHRLGSREEGPWSGIREEIRALRDAARDLRRRLPGADPEPEADPGAIEDRLRRIERLCRRHADAGVDAEGAEERVLQRLEDLEGRMAEGENLAAAAEAGASDLEARRRALGEAGRELSRARERAAVRLAERVTAELGGLGMKGATLRFELEREEDPEGVPWESPGGETRVRAFEWGLERVRPRFRPHPSEAEGDLARIASGGEFSRLLLAIHAALGEASPPGCWVLDEVDSGIGGETASRVAGMLAGMARHAQVLLVTHLPVIAARAERQIRVVKTERSGRPAVDLRAIEGEERVRELARMLSGEPDSATARRHAQELLEAARPPTRGRAGRVNARPGD